MQPLLFLAHRLPFPPNKGDKVRSYHFLKHLAGRYRVYLGTFVDDPADWEHVARVRELCAEVHVEPIAPWARRAKSATALLSGEPLTLAYFRSAKLARWAADTASRERIGRAFVFSSAMAQYAIGLPRMRTVVDFVDMDSAKWGEYARRRRWPAAALYRREAERLLAFEKAIAEGADASIFVTEEETKRFLAEAHLTAGRVLTIRNGVDSEYFSPAHALASPFAPDECPIVFTGAMDYWPNVDAALWFAREVLPLVRKREPRARFYVVGMNPDLAVRALANDGATVVTGRVPDVRPYLKHARAVVAPLRVARGIQNKVLEAMAMEKAVVATPACAAGLGALPGTEIEVAADEPTFARKVASLMEAEHAARMGQAARQRVLENYAWASSFRRLDEVMEPGETSPSRAVAR